jgi:hypothetical protein
MGPGKRRASSALVAIRALFRIKSIRRDAKHIVALDADPVDHRLRRLTGFLPGWRVGVCFGGHARILPR